jgi:sugar phosphate isomerase/epimerase
VNRLSLAQLTINEADAPQSIEAAANAGFDAIGLRVISPAGVLAHPALAGNEALLRKAERALAETDLTVLDVNSFWITAWTTPQNFLPVLDAASQLDAESVLTVINDPDLARAREVLAECCAVADPAGIKIALEFQPYGSVRTLSEAIAVVRGVGMQNIGIVLDVLHLYRSGGQVADLRGVPAELFAFAQICDAPLASPPASELRAEARSRRLYPGEGELPLFDIMDALPPEITLDVETPTERAAHLPVREQAKLAADTTREFLAAWTERLNAPHK